MGEFVLGPRLKTISLDSDKCVIWPGAMRNGYGVKKMGHTTVNAHRYVYENSTGKKIPKGMTLDHTCRNRRCINPKHLEVVTYSENKTRAWGAKAGNWKHKYYKGEPKPEEHLIKKSAFGINHVSDIGVNHDEVSKVEDDTKKKAAIGAGAVGAAGVGAATIPLPVRVESKNVKVRRGKAKVKDLRSVAVGEGSRVGNDIRTARLAQSIREKGFFKDDPILLSRNKQGRSVIGGGHHRIRAAEMLGMKKVPVKVMESNTKHSYGGAPLLGRKKFQRDVKNVRKPNKKLPASEIDRIAAKKIHALGRAYNNFKGSSENQAMKTIVRHPRSAAGVGAGGLTLAGIAAAKKKD